MENHSETETDQAWKKVVIFVVDDVPTTNRLDRRGRPAERFGVPLVEDLWQLHDSIEADSNLGEAQIVMLHIKHAQACHLTKGMTLLEYVVQKVLDRGGWVLLFTGGDPSAALQNVEIKKAFSSIESQRQRGERFELCDYQDLDPVAIQEITTSPPPNWRIENLFNQEWFCSRVLERLTAAQLASEGHLVTGITLQELKKIDVNRFGKLMNVGNSSEEVTQDLGGLVSWLMSIKMRSEERKEVIPENFSLWIHELRRRLNHPFVPAEAEWKLFERERSRLSHALFGNEFANRLGADLDFINGYWLSLEGSDEPGVEDQRESVEGALKNWADIAVSLKSFLEKRWVEVSTLRGEAAEARRQRGLEKVAKIQELLTCMVELVGKPKNDKVDWLKSMNAAIVDMQKELESTAEGSLRREGVAQNGTSLAFRR